MKISVSVADMLVHIYRYQQKYWLGEYIGMGIGRTHIGPTLVPKLWPLLHQDSQNNAQQFKMSPNC